ncbi:hypothetical protein Tco_0985292 [Tanacetum coccineum]
MDDQFLSLSVSLCIILNVQLSDSVVALYIGTEIHFHWIDFPVDPLPSYRCCIFNRTLRGRSLCFVLEMRNQVTPPDTCSVQAPSGGVT